MSKASGGVWFVGVRFIPWTSTRHCPTTAVVVHAAALLGWSVKLGQGRAQIPTKAERMMYNTSHGICLTEVARRRIPQPPVGARATGAKNTQSAFQGCVVLVRGLVLGPGSGLGSLRASDRPGDRRKGGEEGSRAAGLQGWRHFETRKVCPGPCGERLRGKGPVLPDFHLRRWGRGV